MLKWLKEIIFTFFIFNLFACQPAQSATSTIDAYHFDSFWIWGNIQSAPYLSKAKELYILQGEIRKNGISNLIISISKVNVTTDLSIAKVHLSVFPTDKAPEILAAIKTNTPLIKHDLAQRVKNQLRKVPNLSFYIDDSLDYIEGIDNALKGTENPIENPDLLEKRKKS